jgi:small-conductance mechanosensitive channel
VRFSLPVNVSYGADLHRASRAILEVAARHPDTLASPPPEIACTDFSSSSVTLELRVWNDRSVRTSTNYLSDLRIAIFDEFRAQGMEFPFPQLDLHVQRKPGRPAAA